MEDKSVLAMLQENAIQMAEFDHRLKKAEQEITELRDTIAKTRLDVIQRPDLEVEQCPIERILREDREREEDLWEWENNLKKQRRIDELGFFGKYFYLSFEYDKCYFFGEKFDNIEYKVKGLQQIVKDKYDIVMLNSTSVAIVETKFKAHVNDLPDVIKKAETFRINYPDFANHRVYLGLASMSFYDELETECKKAGIAIVKQIGEKVVIADEHLKAF